jgi:hypothetical protein
MYISAALVAAVHAFNSSDANGQSAALPKAATYKPVVGQPHPDFILPSIEDRSAVRLSDFRGKKVLLVHFASW